MAQFLTLKTSVTCVIHAKDFSAVNTQKEPGSTRQKKLLKKRDLSADALTVIKLLMIVKKDLKLP